MKKIYDSKIKMVNDFVWKIVGIGFINFMIYDDKLYILIEIRYVLLMLKNLIFISFLDSRGVEYLCEMVF